MNKINVVISAYNEEKNIKDCLNSVKWADEIILVDNGSTDKTVKIAKKFTDKIFTQPNRLMLNINKNYGFSKAKGDWILSLDADERVTEELKNEIIDATRKKVTGFWVSRKNIIFGQWIKHSIWWPDYQLRLFRKGKGEFPCQHVHEYLQVKGETKKLKNPFLHYNYQTISQYLYKLDKIYTENEAENIIKSGKKLVWQDVLRMPINDFLKTFFAQKGYKDGLHGLVLSLLQSFYALIIFAKVWEKQGFREIEKKHFLTQITSEFKNLAKEFNYWLTQTKLKEEKNPLKKILTRLSKVVQTI